MKEFINMCIAILKTKKGIITDEALINSFNSNSDGSGIAYTIKGKLVIEKGIFDVQSFVEAVRRAEKLCDNNMLIHCRIGTSGHKDANNTHPFRVSDNVCLIHNGILDVDVPKNSTINDTQIFIRDYMTEITDKDLINNKGVKTLLEAYIGTYNKFVLLDNKGNYNIINEKQGHWVEGVWYSNYSYKGNKPTWSYSRTIYDDDYSLSGYPNEKGKTRSITTTMYNDIIDAIEFLTLEEVAALGFDPEYDYITGTLTNVKSCTTAPLRELSQELYDYYESIHDEASAYFFDDEFTECEVVAS
jgi:predicted glutamine amidotransferase